MERNKQLKIIQAINTKLNEDIVYLEGIQEEVLNGYKDNS